MCIYKTQLWRSVGAALSWGGITALSWGLLAGNGAQLGCSRIVLSHVYLTVKSALSIIRARQSESNALNISNSCIK